MKASINWQHDMLFNGKSEHGHVVNMDGNQGQQASSPMELVLMAVAGCSSVDVVSILNKAKQAVEKVTVEVEGTRVDGTPSVFSHIHLHFNITGANIDERHVARAIRLSADKYCSVSIMLGASVEVSHGYTVHAS